MKIDEINVVKANVHNLKSVTVTIPKNKLTVVTGPSGSGKSSLAFDTIYIEGQRRYIESLSSYARQFLGQFQPPDVESITGLSPAIAIDQKSTSRNPRSTVGTITEIYDYLRVLFARAGTLYCVDSGEEVISYTPNQIVKKLLTFPEKSKIQIMSKVEYSSKKEFEAYVSKFMSLGYVRSKYQNQFLKLEEIKYQKTESHFYVVIDRVLQKKENEKRIIDSVELALKLGHSTVHVNLDEKKDYVFSEKNLSPTTGDVYPDLEPRLFSFNSPLGACEKCNGIGEKKLFSKDLIVLDESLSINEGAITPISKKNNFLMKMVQSIADKEKVDLDTAFNKLPKKFINILFEGSDKVYTYKFKSDNSHFEFQKPFPGIPAWLEKKYLETGSEKTRKNLEEYMRITTCNSCEGLRLNKIALSTKIQNKNIMELSTLSIQDLFTFVGKIKFKGEKAIIAEKVLKEILSRLSFLNQVGLGYLNLNRSATTLSGGESQRIRLATQIGSALSGVLYVLDEPSIGLHQRDNLKLIETLKSLRDLGNTVIVVEHDEETMKEADYIIDIGPGAGIHGGKIVSKGPLEEILKSKKSITANYLTGTKSISKDKSEYRTSEEYIHLKKAEQNNLKKIDVKIPHGCITCITGVSGSGKSTLVHQILVPAIKYHLSKSNKAIWKRSNYQSIVGIKDFRSIIELDQSPIGRTPQSNPATYSGLFDLIRALYAKTPESQIRGYKQGRFSFNVKGGRCDACEGNGVKKIEMHFLPDVYVECDECKGSRYNPETLSILYKGYSIADILNLSIEEAKEVFKNHNKINKILTTLYDVGLGYVKLGQPATTLSGGEAQRLKLAKELAKSTRGKCVYFLDEPTTGLHFDDVNTLLIAINRLVDQGHTVVIIEHNLDVIKTADHIIDLGPEGGDEGGKIVAEGAPLEVIKNSKSETAKYLKACLKK